MKVFWVAVAVLLPLAAQTEPTIRVPVRLVSLPVVVFSKTGQLVPGLLERNFHVYDNGQTQKATVDTAAGPLSVVVAIQVNLDVRTYVPFIAKTGSVMEGALSGDSGETAVIAYNDEVTTLKPFDTEDQSPLRRISADGKQARMIDAGLLGVALLKKRPPSRTRVLVFIGQAADSGSDSGLASLGLQAQRENVTVYALALPQFGRAFVSDAISLQGASQQEKGGFKAGLDLGHLIGVLRRTGDTERGADPFSVLASATGGTQLPFRKQRELEKAIAVVGVQQRSAYRLSYYPSSSEPGYHIIKVEVDIPGAKVQARPGYWFGAN